MTSKKNANGSLTLDRYDVEYMQIQIDAAKTIRLSMHRLLGRMRDTLKGDPLAEHTIEAETKLASILTDALDEICEGMEQRVGRHEE